MRWWIAIILAGLPLQVVASSCHACTAPLIVPAGGSGSPQPELEFTLTLAAQDPHALNFVAQGQSFDGFVLSPLLWSGSWISDQAVLRMVGQAETQTSVEWRAKTVRRDEGVMILNIKRGEGDHLMVRCLPKEGA